MEKLKNNTDKHIISLIPGLGMVVIIEPNIKIPNWYRIVALGIQCITVPLVNNWLSTITI
jgi:hypothetical protein